MSDPAKGANVVTGLSEQTEISESEKDLGLENKGKSQKPMSTPKNSVSKLGKKFNFK